MNVAELDFPVHHRFEPRERMAPEEYEDFDDWSFPVIGARRQVIAEWSDEADVAVGFVPENWSR